MAHEYTVTLSSKGQLTLPAAVRQRLALARGARLRLTVRDDGTVELSKPPFARIADLAGIGGGRQVPQSPPEMRQVAHEERWRAKQTRAR